MYIIPDNLELKFPHIIQGYFSSKLFSREDKLNILCNWICNELIAKERSWISIKKELKLNENSTLEFYFLKTTGFSPHEYAEYWEKRK